MFGRSKSSAVLDKVSSTGDTVSDLAGKAVSSAGPVVREAAATASDKLSDAAERAAGLLADAAERLADAAPDGRLTTASQSVADSVRPKRRSRFKTLLVVAATAGGVVALLRSPLAAKLRKRLFGAPDDDFDDEAGSITLPVESTASSSPESTAPTATEAPGTPGMENSADGGGAGSAGNGVPAQNATKSTPASRPNEGS